MKHAHQDCGNIQLNTLELKNRIESLQTLELLY